MNPGIKYEYKLPLDVPVEESIAPPLIRHHSHMASFLGKFTVSYNDFFL